MGNNNSNLQTAKNIKDDEFYTTYEAIEKELQHYLKHFRGKVVLCNCDDPFKSNFCRYFVRNFNKLGLKRLICTSYVASEGSLTQTSLFDCNQIFTAETHGRVLDLKKIPSKAIVFTDDDIENFLRKTKSVRMLCGDGDFRSSECVEYLKQADIVVTNPPFSLFKELVALLVKYQKSYLLIGNQNALTYKEIFPLIQNNQAWTGYQFGDMKFRVPQSSEPRSTRYWVDESGQKWRSLGNAMWLTNLDIERRHEQLVLTKKYDPKEYPHYDTYDAINVRKVTDIPYDYAGIMGVPITIIDKYNSDQFEILGEANHGSDNEYDLFKPTINGKELFKRILIRNRMIQKDNIQEFRVLDLFSGAGGFSYGMEKNTHFKTVIDVLGIIVKGGKSAIAFIEAKKTQLNLHDLGQLWAYCKLCDPAEAFLLSSAGIGSLNKILNNLSRTDLLDFGDGRKIKKMQVAKWDITSNSIDFRTLVPRI